jgi:hypothetical protein
MVCPVCGEPLDLEGYEAGDLLDCEACGAVLRLLSDGSLEVVELPEGEEEPLWGLEAYGEGDEVVLRFSDGTLEEEVRALEADLLEALRRVVFPGAPDLLEFTLPSGSVYEFPFRQVVKTLRPILL